MLTLYIENGILYVEQMKDLKFPIMIDGVKYTAEDDISFEDVEVVRALLMRNARVLVKQDNILIRPNLYDFEMALDKKEYKLVDGLPKVEKVVDGAKFEVVEPGEKPVMVAVTDEDIKEAEEELQKEIDKEDTENKAVYEEKTAKVLDKERDDEGKDYNKKKNRNKNNKQESDK